MQLAPFVNAAAATALTILEVVVMSCQVPPLRRHWNRLSTLAAADAPISWTQNRSRNVVSSATTPCAGLASWAACQPCVLSASSSTPKR
ncbi:MAG TPA: hypothetical protein DCP69_05830 [Candidatus Omnitrophica bacterium]|nr:hypothetical protein [Candidatus Omnitrophota bacterium]